MPDPFAQYAVGAKDDPFSAYAVKTDKEPSTVQPLIGHPLTASDETPTWKDRLVNGFVDNPYIQGAAHPKELGDFASLLSYETPAAVIRMARPVIAPVANAAASVLENVKAAKALIPGANPAKNLIPFEKMAGRLRTIADTSKDAAMGVTRGATPPSQFQRSTDSAARALEPIAEIESLPVPSHLDMSRQVRPGQLTPQQMAEREGAAYAREIQGGEPTMTGRIRTPSIRERFPQGLPREMPAAIEPMPSHGPSVGASMLENAELRAKQILPDVPPASGRVPTGHGSQPDNLLETLPDEPVASAMQQPRVDVGAERVGRAQGLSKEQVRAQTAPILGEAQGAASPILPQKALNNIIDAMKALPKEGGAREAYVQAATSGKAQWQIENIRRTLEHLGLLVPAAAAISPDVRGMLLDRMRSGVTGGSNPQQ
jgi:hypothetical protein